MISRNEEGPPGGPHASRTPSAVTCFLGPRAGGLLSSRCQRPCSRCAPEPPHCGNERFFFLIGCKLTLKCIFRGFQSLTIFFPETGLYFCIFNYYSRSSDLPAYPPTGVRLSLLSIPVLSTLHASVAHTQALNSLRTPTSLTSLSNCSSDRPTLPVEGRGDSGQNK